MISDDTIVAFSSTVAPAARIILRLSGSRAWALAEALGATDLAAGGVRYAHLSIAAKPGGQTIGAKLPCLTVAFQQPRSYTGEDLIELHLPGNPLLARMILEDLTARGARPAEPGEFTARAYFNCKIDLAEAEGVAAVIAAHSEAELRGARQLLSGELARRLLPAMDLLAETLALLEVGIDFSEEEVTFLTPADLHERVRRIDRWLESLMEESTRFDRLAHEPTTVLVGRPNAGKSTLLNALAGARRAVVSEVAGTTRDALVAEVSLRRGMIRLIDVAGLEVDSEAADTDESPQAEIARQMRARALRTLEQADFAIYVRDVTDTRPPIEIARPVDLHVGTKSDLAAVQTELEQHPARQGAAGQHESLQHEAVQPAPRVTVSARTGANLSDLKDQLDALTFGASAPTVELALTSRHIAALSSARQSLARAGTQVDQPELTAVDLREALENLGQILGHISPDELLGKIFSRFCIGK